MKLTSEQIEAVKELAMLPSYTAQKICRIMGIDYDTMSHDADFSNALDSGRLLSAGQFDKKVQTLSNQGSGPAQSLQLKMMQHTETQEMREYYG